MISHIGETKSGSTCTTELNESQDNSGRCSGFDQGFMEEILTTPITAPQTENLNRRLTVLNLEADNPILQK